MVTEQVQVPPGCPHTLVGGMKFPNKGRGLWRFTVGVGGGAGWGEAHLTKTAHISVTASGRVNDKQVVNRLKIPQGLSTLLFLRWSEVAPRGGVRGDSP